MQLWTPKLAGMAHRFDALSSLEQARCNLASYPAHPRVPRRSFLNLLKASLESPALRPATLELHVRSDRRCVQDLSSTLRSVVPREIVLGRSGEQQRQGDIGCRRDSRP